MRIERALQQQLDAGCSEGVFPGASACAAIWRGDAWLYVDVVAGAHAEGADLVAPDTIFDLASLTKPWVAVAALRLHQAGVFELGARVDHLIPEATGLAVGERTWEEVLSHCCHFAREASVSSDSFLNPCCRANRKAPSPTSSTCWVFSMTRRATEMGFLMCCKKATAPQLPFSSMMLASSVT